MKLQKKTLLFFVALLIVFLLAINIFFTTILLASYSALEEQYIEKDLNQAVNKLNDELFSMSSIASDWGPWDDTVDFVNGKDPNYLNSNLQPYGFDNLKLNLIVITNTKGQVLFSGTYDLKNKVMVPVPAYFSGPLDLKNPLMNMSDPHQITSGIVMLPDDPMLVVSQPIVHSDYSGPPQGVIIMGRYLNNAEISRLAELTQPSLTLTRIDDPALSKDLVSRIRDNSGSASGIIQQLNGDQVAGYALVHDIYGNEALVLQITEARSIYHRGIDTTVQVILIILSGGLFLGILVIFLLDRVLLKRMHSLADQVNMIGKSGSIRDHVVIKGDDELSELATEINRMLVTIEKFHNELGASEARFDQLAEQSGTIVWEVDARGLYTFVSHVSEAVWGYRPDELMGRRHFYDLHPESGSDSFKTAAFSIFERKEPFWNLENTVQAKDGHKVDVSTNGIPILNPDGTLLGYRGSDTDITERKKAEKEIVRTLSILESTMESTADGILVVDRKGGIVLFNVKFKEMWGIPEAIIVSKKDNDAIRFVIDQLKEPEIFIKTVRDLYNTPEKISFDLLELKDGRVFERYSQPQRIGDFVSGRVWSFRDITERNRAEEGLAESEGKYRALTENTGDILFSMDMAGIFTYISPQVNKYGFLVDEIIGKTIRDVIHPEDITRVENDLYRDLEKGAQFHSTFRIFDKWGHVHWFDEKGTLRLDLSGKPVGIYGVLRDDSERRQAEDALGLANKKLNLMNNITRHDILNTITGIYGCVDMAKATHSSEERELLLNDIKDLILIIQRQITFTREYQEVGVNRPQWQNVNDLIYKTLQNFEKSGLTFTTEFEKMEIFADPLLEKVFYNLVDNAIRYGVTITTISISHEISDKGLSLVFKDDGVGVEAGQKQEIFKRGVGKNTGMGLFLTAEILAITGIAIEEDGVFGKGARFEIRIPNGTWRFPRN
jgi:PAS domain S-box-containing protein